MGESTEENVELLEEECWWKTKKGGEVAASN